MHVKKIRSNIDISCSKRLVGGDFILGDLCSFIS